MNNQILIDICDSVIKGLKDFQSATVNKICGNFLDKDNPQFRQLVADEVGMGKTIIAKGVIAKLVYNQLQNTNSDTEYEQKDNTIASQNLPKIFKIVYVCTNQTLASQNIRKLNVFSRTESEGKECSENFNNTLNTRLSMLHFQIAQIAQIDNNFPIQFISITPSTSFKLGYGKGNVNERALIYCLLSDCYKFKKYRFMLLFLILKGNVSLTNWINVCRSTAQKINEYSNYKERIQKLIKEKISKVINNESDKNNDIKIKNAKKNLKTLYKKLKSKIPNFYETSNNKYVIPSNDAPEIEEVYQNLDEKIKQHITPIINSLRSMFALISIDMLQPDLVIMDEFQRYEYLINPPEDEISEDLTLLIKKFIPSDVDNCKCKVLLLSATPYKPFSTSEEISSSNEDTSYSEFMKVVNFLFNSEQKKSKNLKKFGKLIQIS